MAETVNHKQIPVYFDQMVDDVFLNGNGKGAPEAAAKVANRAELLQKVAALPPVQRLAPQSGFRQRARSRCLRAIMAAGLWCSLIADPTLGISWRMGGGRRFPRNGFIDTLDPRTRKRMPNPSIELPADRLLPPPSRYAC
jgi:hypothetical protein